MAVSFSSAFSWGCRLCSPGVKRPHLRQPQEATVSEGKAAHLALGPAGPHQLSWFYLLCALFAQAGVSLSPLPDKSCSSQTDLWAERQEHGFVKAQLERGLGAPHQGAAEPLCHAPLRHYLLPALTASGQPEVLHNPVLNAAVGGHGRIWFRQ